MSSRVYMRMYNVGASCCVMMMVMVMSDGAELACVESAAAAGRCRALPSGHDEHLFYVDGVTVNIDYAESEYVLFRCVGNVTLDSDVLPRFTSVVRVRHVTLAKCATPLVSYVSVLRALNVIVLQRFSVSDVSGLIVMGHLSGLTCDELAITGAALAPDALDLVPHARRLRLQNTRPVPLARLPPALVALHLVSTGVTLVSSDVLARLHSLTSLSVRDGTSTLRVEPVAPLASLALQVRAVTLSSELPHTLVNVTMHGWVERVPAVWRHCTVLATLTLYDAALETLPEGWLGECAALVSLSVVGAPALSVLGASALHGASLLETVTVTDTSLRELPEGVFDRATRLRVLNLSNNKLHALPNGLFAMTSSLTDLRLDRNMLQTSAYTTLGALHTLQVLKLDHNVALGDACGGGVNSVRGTSVLHKLLNLRELYLRNTSASIVCRDWRYNMPLLTRLDLRDNHFTYLTYEDLQFTAAEGNVDVYLTGNNITEVKYLREDYTSLMSAHESHCGARAKRASRANVTLSCTLVCDCRAVWAARALNECVGHVNVSACCARDGRALVAMSLQELTCDTPASECGAPSETCTCGTRESTQGHVRRVKCTNVSDVPLVTSPTHNSGDIQWELVLSNNNITHIESEQLPQHLLELDVRNNSLLYLSEDVLSAVSASGGVVLLAGNNLSCACEHSAHVRSLLRHKSVVSDVKQVTCNTGASLTSSACTDTGPYGKRVLLAASVTIAVLTLTALALFVWRRRGDGRAPDTDRDRDGDKARPYDVFVSFSHHDDTSVSIIVEWLEAQQYVVCVHSKDWAPGGYIPAQISASVRRSRRTLAVVSPHFLRSTWARAEFREAHAATLRDVEPRLVLVLTEEPALLPLDAELRQYIANNTYLLWGDRYFWKKLRAALPPPRPAVQSSPLPATPSMLELKAPP